MTSLKSRHILSNLAFTVCFLQFNSAYCQAKSGSNPASVGMITRIKMIDAKEGWCLSNFDGRNSIMITKDGAKHWTIVLPKKYSTLFNIDDPELQSVGTSFLNSHVAWVAQPVLDKGVRIISVCHTTNGGKTWTETRFPAPKQIGNADIHISDVFADFVDPKHGYILTESETGNRYIYHKAIYGSHNSGKTWSLLADDRQAIGKRIKTLPSLGFVTGFHFNTSTRGWMTTRSHDGDDASLYESTDGGKDWNFCLLRDPFSVQASSHPAISSPIFFGRDHKVGIVAKSFLDAQGDSTVATYSTHDNGGKWRIAASSKLGKLGQTPVNDFCDLRHGWMWDSDGLNLYSTRNSGRNWVLQRSGHICEQFYTPIELNFITLSQGWAIIRPAICIDKVKKSYLVTGRWISFLYHTINGGKTWTKQDFILE